jgi:ribosomal protein L18E
MIHKNIHQDIKDKQNRIKDIKDYVNELGVISSNKDCNFWKSLKKILNKTKDEYNKFCMERLDYYTKDPVVHLIEVKTLAAKINNIEAIIKQVDDVNELLLDKADEIKKINNEISNLSNKSKLKVNNEIRQEV